MHFSSLVHLIGRDFLDGRSATFGLPCQLLHQQYVDYGIEVGTRLDRILHGHHLRAVRAAKLLEQGVVVAILVVQLVNQEDDGLVELSCIAEVVLCAHLDAGCALQQDDCCIRDAQGRDGCACKVVRTRTVDDVQFLAVPFHMEYGREYAVAILMLHREAVADGVMQRHTSAAFDDTGLVQQCLGQSGLTGTVITQQGNVLDFVCLINLHCVLSCYF